MNLSERFRYLRKELSFTQTQFGELFNLSQDAISAIETGKNKPTIEVMTILHDSFNVNIEWLILGKDPMLNPEPLPVKIEVAYKILNEVPEKISYDETGIYVPVVNSIPDLPFSLNNLTISRRLVQPHQKQTIRSFFMEGDSMRPTINHGDYLLFAEKYLPGADGFYILSREKQLSVKRISFKNNGGMTLYSENSTYPPEEISPDEQDKVDILGKVILIIQKV